MEGGIPLQANDRAEDVPTYHQKRERFAANTADMTQDDFFVIAILEMCTDLELSKRFREVKTGELTWEKLRDVAEVYERVTASDNRVILVNSNKKNWKKNQNTQSTGTKQCFRCNRKGHEARECRTDKRETLLQILQG